MNARTNSPSSPDTDVILGLEDDADGTTIVREELRLHATVIRALDAAAQTAKETKAGRGADDYRLLELRDEVATAKPEDLPALFEQMHHIGALRAQRGKGAVGSIDRASPYFGHLRLEEKGKRRDVLIGAKSYVDPSAGVRIVDWRHAPVSRIYYRYNEDDDYEETLGDRTVEGRVLARRSVAIVQGAIVRVAAPHGTYIRAADGRWSRVEASRAKLQTERQFAAAGGVASSPRLGIGADGQLRKDKHLPAIASMLDSAQFELIARPGSGLVAIQGSAGSGKTTVGLHRVAYLNFIDPQRFKPEKMVVIVPHDALAHYVERVLPSLEVEGVAVTTFARISGRIVRTLFPKLPLRISDDTPPVVSRAKSHPAMLRAIDEASRRLDAEIESRVEQSMRRWPMGDRVIAALAKTKGEVRTPPDMRLTVLASWLAAKRTLDGIAPASTLPAVTRSALERLGHELRHTTRGVAAIWDELLTNRARLSEIFRGEASFGPGQLDQMHDWCVRQTRIRQEGERDGESATLDIEDHALLLRIYQVVRGPLVGEDTMPIRFVHMFVDEVQDANPIALRVLIDMTSSDRCVTLAGDTAQRMFDDGDDRGEFDWNQLLDDLEVPHTKLEPLKVSYRSTAEITSFARNVLGSLAHESEPIATRHGPPIELHTFASQGEAVAFLADALKQLAREEPQSNVALIARFGAQADVYYEGLVRAEVPNVRRVAQQDFTWEPGVDVTDVRQTKGLEFDEVILLDTNAASYPDAAPARHAMYVASTRAAHQLWCVASEAPSPVVTASLAVATPT